jgi:hypothetical protein
MAKSSARIGKEFHSGKIVKKITLGVDGGGGGGGGGAYSVPWLKILTGCCPLFLGFFSTREDRNQAGFTSDQCPTVQVLQQRVHTTGVTQLSRESKSRCHVG